MKVKTTAEFEVEISELDQRKITLDTLRKTFGWGAGYRVCLVTNKLLEAKHYTSSHSWTDEIVIRDATEEDILLQKVLNTFVRLTLNR